MLAIIPARAGSKGLPGKNKKLFCGRPLIEWTIEAAVKSSSVSSILVSTDDEDLLGSNFVKSNVDFLVRRPKELATDESSANQYIEHSLKLALHERHFEFFCVLQPTSPLRISSDIDEIYRQVLRNKTNCGVTAVDVPHKYLPESLMEVRNGIARPTSQTLQGSNLRQFKKNSYIARNGSAVYVCRTDYFLKNKTLFDKAMSYHLMPMIRSIDIDTLEDFELAELIMKGNK